VCLDISGDKFPEIYSNLSGNLLKHIFTQYFLIITICIYCKISTFLINNSPDLYALTLRIMFRKN